MWHAAWVIFFLALVVRSSVLLLAYQAHLPSEFLELAPDSKNYVSAGLAIMRGEIMDHRNDLFYFPVGYSFLLACSFQLFGQQALPVLIFQVLLSAAGCVLVFLIALELGLNAAVAQLAGMLSVFSVTSLALCSYVLSDTLYTFLFALSLWLFVRVLRNRQLVYFAFIGIVSGCAMLVRPVGKFWPLMMVVLTFSYLWTTRNESIRSHADTMKLGRGIVIAMLIACLIPLPWVVRNYIVHGFPVLAITTISAPATLAAKAQGDIEGKNYRTIQTDWDNEYLARHTDDSQLLDGLCRQAMAKTQQVQAEHPFKMLKAYATWSWENVNAPDYLLSTVHPFTEMVMSKLNEFMNNTGLIRARLYLALAGLVILLFGGHYRAALILGGVYGYCAITIGAFPYQGSRYFLPGQIPVLILVAITIVFGVTLMDRVVRTLVPVVKKSSDL